MSLRSFADPAARASVTREIKSIEARTSAEVVVVVRGRSGSTWQARLIAGDLCGFGVLLALLLLPQEFSDWAFGLDVALAAAFGLWLGGLPPLQRLLTTRPQRRRAVGGAAAATFLDHRIHATGRRQGILVYASTLEREVAIVPDAGLAESRLGPDWAAARQALEGALRQPRPYDAFLRALGGLGAPLAKAYPAQAGQANELPDEMDGAT